MTRAGETMPGLLENLATLLFASPSTRWHQAATIWRLKRALEAWERARDQTVMVRHRLPGRVRLTVASLIGSASLAERLEKALPQLPGVQQVAANPLIGSLLVVYAADEVEEIELRGEIFRLVQQTAGPESRPPSPPPPVSDLFHITVLHSLPGRVRLHVPIIAYAGEYQTTVTDFFQQQAGIKQINLNPLTATALVYYDETVASLEEILALINQSFPLVGQMLGSRLSQPPSTSLSSTIGGLAGLPFTATVHPVIPAVSPWQMKSDHNGAGHLRTVQERSMYATSSRAKLLDFLISGSTLGLTFWRRREGWMAPPFGLRRFLTVPALTSLTVGSSIFRNGLSALLQGSINADTLSTVAIIAALLAGKDLSALVTVMLANLGEMITAYSAERTRAAIAGMLSVGEPYVWQIRPDGREVKVPLEQIQPGDTIAVRTGEKISVDGMVLEGAASVDQASITGEFMPMQKSSRDQVFAGTVVKRGRIVVKAERVGDATAVARIIHQVEEASQRRAPIQNFADKFSQHLVPISFLMAGLIYLLTRDLNRALNMLIIDYSCGVRLSTATAFSSSVFNAARQGILVKGGSYLELLSDVDTLVLDKTGTVTEGKPTVVEVQPTTVNGTLTDKEVMTWAAAAEQHTTHPLADAVLRYVKERAWSIPHLEQEEIVIAHGVRARANGHRILVGSRRFLDEQGIALKAMSSEAERMASEGQSVLYVAVNGQLIGLVGIQDRLRQDMKKALNRLRRLGIDDVILLTGDVEDSAAQIADRLAVDRFRASVLPEDKVAMVRQLQTNKVRVVMVGEGINDAPALAHADVGIVMGAQGADVTVETADVTLIGDDPLKIPGLMQISRQTMRVVRQNFAVAVGVNTLGIMLGALGYISPMMAAVLHNSTTVAVVLNSARLLVYKPKS